MFAAAIWHNVLQPLNVSGETGGAVDPLDVLTIINEINGPSFSDPTTGFLPLELPDGTRNPYFDIDCDSRVTPLDVLNVINALNSGVYEPDWVFSASHSGSPTQGRVVNSGCSPKLLEGDSLFTDLSQTVVIPDTTSAIRVSFEPPVFDTLSQNSIRDSFEVLLLDQNGQPLVLPYAVQREASFNWSESISPIVGAGSQTTASPQVSLATATFNVSGLATGTKVQVKTRLVNNDGDSNTAIVIRRVEIIDSQTPAPTGMPIPVSDRSTRPAIDLNLLVDVTASVQLNFGRSTLVDGEDVFVTDLQIKNGNSSAISGRMLLVVDNLSDTQLSLFQPDGYLELGKPYFILNANGSDVWLANGQSSTRQEIRFRNPNKQQFQFAFKVLAEVNSAPSGFVSSPLYEIQAGKTYETTTKAIDPDGQRLVYSKVVGPAAMSIDSASGMIRWLTATADIGSQSVVVRATDPFGLSVDQAFAISVLGTLQNRPPVFTSTPLTDATVARPFEVLTYQAGSSPNAAASGEFGMGKLSIITANPGDQQLSLISSTGNEKFGPAQNISVGEIHPSKFATPFITGASVDLGFAPNTYSNNERNVLSVINADVNGDGYLDFGVAIDTNGSDFGPNDIGSVGVRLGNGDGTFREGWQVQLPAATLGGSGVSSRADSIRFGDVNGDERPDLVVVQSLGSRALVYTGKGDGTFANSPIESAVNESFTYSYSSQLGDMNNDGTLDLVSYESQRDGRFRTGTHVRLGDGTGKFSNGTFYANENNNSGDGYLADVNGDGKLDTVRINYSDARVETRLNVGSGLLGDLKFSSTFFMVGNSRGGYTNPTSGYLADFSRDGKTDIVVSTFGVFILLVGNGDGTFGDATENGNRLVAVNPASSYSTPLQLFPNVGRNDGKAPDLNDDGIPDFVFGNLQVAQLTTAVNDGTGKFTTRVYQSGFGDDIGNGSVRGSNPTPHVSVGDFNGDGVSDVLLGRDQSNASSVRVGGVGIALGGNKPGSLRLPEVTFSGDEAFNTGNGEQVLADFDNDGILDIASNIRSGVVIAKGRADGSFDNPQTGFNQFGVFPYNSLVTSDFDRDGNMDIAYFASLNNPGHAPSMTTLFGLGNGTFQRSAAPVPSTVAGTGISSGTISQQYGVHADVNADGYPDVIYRIANNHSNLATAKSIVVYLYDPSTRNLKLVSDRDSLLVTPHRGGFYQDEVVAFEDLNGDGKKELVAHSGAIGQNGITTTPERLTIWQPTNNTSATDATDLFTRREFVDPGISPGLGVEGSINALLVADYNHDGKPDIAVGSQNGTSRVLMGNGDFTYRTPVTYNTNQSTGLRTADVNGDGNLDLVPIWGGFYNYNDLPNAGVLLGRTDGSFGAYDGLTTSGYELNSPLSGDFNQDGRDDINYGNYFNSRLTLLAASPGLDSVATGDINGDGKLDIVALETGFARLKILLGNGDDTFTRQKDLIAGLQPESLLLQDINGDGTLDILTANRVSKSISLFTSNGAGSFSRTDLALSSQPNRLAVGDINNDGKPDIIAISKKSQSLSTLLSTATGFAPTAEQPIGFAAADVVFGDLTLDGKLDAILSDPVGKRIVTLPGQGNGSFGVPIIQPLQQTPDRIASADLNADGKPDVIASFPTQNQVGFLFGRGAGRLTTQQLIGVGEHPASISVNDINGDSKPDFLVTNSGDDTLSVIINRYDPTSVYRYTPTATDSDADPVTFELLNAPGGALYDEATQTIVWAPMPDQVGSNAVVVRASDGRGGFAEQGFSVTVTAPVATVSPSFTSEPIAEVSIDQAYVYQPRISNPSNEPVRFSLIDAPKGATIDPTTGKVNWDPRENGLSLGVRGSYSFPNSIENRGGISIPASPSINTVKFTAEGWYKFDSLDISTLFRKFHSSFYNSWTLSNFYGTLRAEINNFGNTPDVRLDTIRLTTNTWYHIAFAYDDETRLAQIFVNGELVGSVVSTGSLQLSDGALSVDGLEGTVAKLRFWNRSLTTQEVRNSMLQLIPSNSTGLVIDYHFAEGPDSLSFADTSPFGNIGMLFINGDFSRYNFPTRTPSVAAAVTVPFTIRVDDGKGGIATQSFSLKTLPPFAKSIQGTVYDDVNGNGLQDGVNETGIDGQVVFVDQNGNQHLDTNETRTTTDATGSYSLSTVGTHANVVLSGKLGRVQSSPILPAQFVELSNGNASGVNFGTKAVRDGNPAFVSVAPTIATVPGEYRYQAYAQSTDGSPIQYAIAVAPDSASIDAMNGLLKWTPKFSDAGSADIILKATDGAGRVVLQAFRVAVSINTAPFITSSPSSSVAQSVLYHYDVQAQDAEQSALTFSFEQSPSGSTIDSAKGNIRWTPSPTQLGSQVFVVVVSDGKGMETKQSFDVNVAGTSANSSPVLNNGPRTSAQVGVTYRSSVVATDADNDLLTYSWVSGPANASITSEGLISWIPTQLGPQSMRVRVADNRGGTDERSYAIDVGSSPTKGLIRFTSSPVVNAVTDRAYAYDSIAPGAQQYQLLAAPIGMSIDPVLGRIRWKPTIELLGQTTVRIQAIDALGNTDEQSFAINVRRSDVLPSVTSVPPTRTAVGSTYVYVVEADNPSGNPLVYSLSVAPLGMAINAQTGSVSWTPTAAQIGPQAVLLRVTDGAGNYLTQSFAIEVTASTPNRQPIATSTPPEDATAATPIDYRFTAVDPDRESLVYAVVAGPTGLSIDPATGVLTWTPTTAQIGTVSITLIASDPLGAAAVQSFLIDVRGANRAPSVSSVPPRSVPQGGLFRYDVIATDPDRELLFFELVSGPQGMTIDSLGRVRWQTAPDTQLGERPVSVRVTDGRGGSVVQDFRFNVVADTTAPRISIITSSAVLFPWTKEPSVVKVQAVDDVAVTSLQLFVDGQAVALRSDGTADVYFSGPGNGKLLAYAFDPAGNRGSTTNKLLMCSGLEECIPDGNVNQPQTAITNIKDGDAVTGFVEVVGTATSVDFESYELSYRRMDQTTYTKITNSTTGVTSGLLGKWDTTLLENDSYILRLEARDQFGGFSAIEREVGVSGNLKLGNFRLSFSDLTIPVAGIPITIARTYDTLRADRSGDFGYGWRMEYRNTDLRTSLPKTGLEDQGIYTAFKPNTKVYLTLPGGQREGFTFTPDIRVLPGYGSNLVIATPRFTPDRGVTNRLSTGSDNLLVNERGELYASGGIPWNPGSPDFSGYTLTTPDGIQYKIDGTGNLNATIDRNGNTLSFSKAGISSTSGEQVTFARDAKGRIVAVTDPAGNSVRYSYDAKGDLVRVTDRMGNVTKFTYRTDRVHYLDSVIDPLGRTGAKAIYGPDGRLTGTLDATGHGPTVSYDPDNSLVTTTDALGNKTISEYDSRGNVVSQIDAMGGVTLTTYDLNNNSTSTTDALGRKTTYTVDDSGNVTGTTDPLGRTRRATFDSYGNQLSSTDALGRTTKSEFDARGNLLATVDVTGAKTTISSDSRGQLTSVTLVGGGQLSVGYFGTLATSSTDLNGLASQFSFNANGLSTGRTFTVSTASGPANATERTEYDANGRVISTTDASGATRRTEYDIAGQVIAEIDPRGRRTTYQYDSAGRRIRVTRPDGSSTQTAYDAAGRATSITDALGRTTRYQFDAIGRQIATVFADDTPLTLADNPRTQTVYNLAGEVIAQLDEHGNHSEFEYDLNGQRVLVRDPLGFVTRTTYNETGAVVSVTDALNRTSTILYDAFGQQIGTRSPDGSTTSQTLNERGLPATKLDELGRTTSYSYTASGQLQSVTDALGNSIHYEYNTRGKLVKQIDANGRITRWEYDILGREVARILPGGQAWRTEYNDLGQISRTIDPNGQSILFTYDSLGRLSTKTRSDGAVFTQTYTLAGQLSTVTDSRGVTQYVYDVRERLLSRTEPDGQVIRYTYDDAGRTTSMATLGGTVRYGYDAASRLTSVTDPTGGITKYTFNAVGSLTRTDFSNGVVELREYDTNSRLTRKAATGSTGTLTDYRYTLDATGRAISFTGDGETLHYTYDAVYRLTNEQATSGRNVSFTYDAVGNRLTRTDTVGSTVYQYDVNDRLTRTTTGSTVTDFTYDDAGNQLHQQTGAEHTDYTWDASNRMIRASVTKAGSTAVEEYKYDAEGNRVAVVNASGETRYMLDLNGQLSQVAAEYTPSGLLIATMVRGNGVIGETRNGVSSILLTDRLGSVSVVTGATGAELARYAYDAFGNIVASSGGAGTPLRFTGEPQSLITGLNFFRARSYDSTTGRFFSADPFIGTLQNALSRHRYQYGDVDPVNKTDPSGLSSLTEVLVGSAIIGSLSTAYIGGRTYGPVGVILGGLYGAVAAPLTVLAGYGIAAIPGGIGIVLQVGLGMLGILSTAAFLSNPDIPPDVRFISLVSIIALGYLSYAGPNPFLSNSGISGVTGVIPEQAVEESYAAGANAAIAEGGLASAPGASAIAANQARPTGTMKIRMVTIQYEGLGTVARQVKLLSEIGSEKNTSYIVSFKFRGQELFNFRVN